MPNEQGAYPLQRRLSRVHSRRLLAIIDKYCSAISETDEIHRIETLELDLGEIPLDALEETLIERFEEAFRRQLAEAIRDQRPVSSNGRSVKTMSHLELFEYFVETGTLPWWTDPAAPALLDACVAWLADHAPAALTTLTADLFTHEPFLKRIIQHLSDASLLTLAGLFSETLFPGLGLLHADLTTLFGKADALRALPSHRLRYALWATILLAVSPPGTPPGQRSSFVETLLLQVAVRCGIRYTDLLDALVEAGPRLSQTGYRFKSALPDVLITLHAAATPSAPGSPALGTASPSAETTATTPAPQPPSSAKTAQAKAALPSSHPAETTQPELLTRPPTPESTETEPPPSRTRAAEAAETQGPTPPATARTTPPASQLTEAETPSPEETLYEGPEAERPASSETAASDRAVPAAPTAETMPAKPPAPPPTSQPTEIETLFSPSALAAPDAATEASVPTPTTPQPPSSAEPPAPAEGSETEPPLAAEPSAPDSVDTPSPGQTLPSAETAETEPVAPPTTSAQLPPPTPFPEATKAPGASPDEAARKPGNAPPRRKQYRRHTFSATEELYISNAGLVILWPFLGQFFGQLGLLEARQFKEEEARHRAVGLLQFLADGQPEPSPEYLLPLNKVLCGMDVEEVFDSGPPFTEAESEESAALLQAVIAHAPVLGTMSVPGFRGTFLLRKGQLSTRDGIWLLRVERETYDVVLDRFPWQVNIVKLPWMKAMMQVEW